MLTRPLENIIGDLNVTTKILGLNVSGKKTIAVYGDMNGMIYQRMQMETPATASFLEGFDAVCSLADKLLKLCRVQGLSSPEVISLAISGPLNISKGMISPPQICLTGRMHNSEGVWQCVITCRLLLNIAVMLPHWLSIIFGAGIGVKNLILLDLEPVVTVGILLQGVIYHGDNDAAGDIGRMRMTRGGPAGLGEPGSLTGYASGFGMAELASLRFPERWPTPPQPYDLVQAVNEGEQEALTVVGEAADHLGKALLWIIFTLDPELVIFGHPGDVLGEALLSPLRDAVLFHGGGEARQLPLLALSKLGAKLDDTAALMAVIDPFKRYHT